jgi:hypothetical protein
VAIYLLDNTLKVEISFDKEDCDYDDNICVSITEDCPHEEKVLIADQTNIYLTPQQALEMADALLQAVRSSRLDMSGC